MIDISQVLAPGGLIERSLKNYEHRPQQVEMAKAVMSALKDDAHLIVEAGTGVGKSFAYLIPAIDFAVSNSERVVISTYTINLQEQLVKKDIPFLQSILPYDFRVALAKGRSNYICMRRLENLLLYERGLFETKEEVNELARIQRWALETEDGSLSDIEPQPKQDIWNMLCCEADLCLGPFKCPYSRECFYQRARQNLNNAHILVVNHHLLFSDMFLKVNHPRACVLPDYGYLIVDEAHNIERTATDHASVSISRAGVRHLLDLICNRNKKGGLLIRIGMSSKANLVEKARRQAETFFDSVEKWIANEPSGVKRIKEINFVENVLDEALNELGEALEDLIPSAKDDEEEKEIRAYADRCLKTKQDLETILNMRLQDHVYWVEVKSERLINISLNASPIVVSDALRTNMFNSLNSVILTGATLSVNGTFEHLKNRIGLNKCRELILGSPFDYQKQVKIYISKDMPDPNDEDSYSALAAEKIKKYLEMTNGKAFILFTSYKMLNDIYSRLSGWLQDKGMKAYKQGSDMSRSAMLEAFREDINSVLFGTASFWEGVDVQGESLSNVIIVRLPFSVPTDPLVEARINDIESKGGNAFSEYSLPEAIIRLKQGFGRLIRTKTDKGIFVVLDSRILNKPYGKMFIESLPSCEVVVQ